jgi:hypothetical protein
MSQWASSVVNGLAYLSHKPSMSRDGSSLTVAAITVVSSSSSSTRSQGTVSHVTPKVAGLNMPPVVAANSSIMLRAEG